MPYATIEVYMGEFDDNILIEELEYRGYTVTTMTEKQIKHYSEDEVWKLWLSWQHDKDEFFEKKLKQFFSEQLDIEVR